ncbi:hypothetical protein HMPREF1870_02839 [Bacteroidales bacterium KA00344]|nr:hypothetical protein HMPREF1870_02839 [Bacteroidales bacterium KA00344]
MYLFCIIIMLSLFKVALISDVFCIAFIPENSLFRSSYIFHLCKI